MSAPRVLCVGLSCIDYSWHVERFPPVGSRTHATAFRQHGGGPAATAAVTVAVLGGEVELWAVHGDDAAGAAANAELRRVGVGVEHVRSVAGATTFASGVIVGPTGERWIFPYRGDGLADEPSAYPLDRVDSFDAVLVDFRHPAICRAAVAAAREAGVPVVADVSSLATWQLAEDADHLIASEECAREVLGAAPPGAGASADAAEAALAALAFRPDQISGVTLGDEGYVYRGPDGVRHISALPVEVVDTTGAGDVFHGAYAYGVARRWGLERCGMFASVAAAVSCTGTGRDAIPDAQSVEHLLETKTLREMNELRWT